MTQTRFETGDPTVDAALAELAVADPATADRADDGFTALTWGRGLPTVSLRGLQDFLWYQLPFKHGGPLARRWPSNEPPRRPSVCCSTAWAWPGTPTPCRGSATDQVLAAYAADDRPGSPPTAKH